MGEQNPHERYLLWMFLDDEFAKETFEFEAEHIVAMIIEGGIGKDAVTCVLTYGKREYGAVVHVAKPTVEEPLAAALHSVIYITGGKDGIINLLEELMEYVPYGVLYLRAIGWMQCTLIAVYVEDIDWQSVEEVVLDKLQ